MNTIQCYFISNLSHTANPEPAEHIQLEENMSPESGRKHGVMTQPDQVDLPVEEAVPSLEPSEHSRTSEQEPQRPQQATKGLHI